MIWLKKIPDLFGFGWIFEKILTWIINKEIKKLDRELRKKRVLVIDDDRGMKSYVEKFVEGVVVDQLYRIPDDLSVLLAYDAVVVDGLGIGNGRFEEGFDLCMAYDKPDGQSVVYYSGLGAYGSDRDALSERGVAVVTKGSNPEKLVLAIRFAMKKRSNVMMKMQDVPPAHRFIEAASVGFMFGDTTQIKCPGVEWINAVGAARYVAKKSKRFVAYRRFVYDPECGKVYMDPGWVYFRGKVIKKEDVLSGKAENDNPGFVAGDILKSNVKDNNFDIIWFDDYDKSYPFEDDCIFVEGVE